MTPLRKPFGLPERGLQSPRISPHRGSRNVSSSLPPLECNALTRLSSTRHGALGLLQQSLHFVVADLREIAIPLRNRQEHFWLFDAHEFVGFHLDRAAAGSWRHRNRNHNSRGPLAPGSRNRG